MFFHSLTNPVRAHMLSEIEADHTAGRLYESAYLRPGSMETYRSALVAAAEDGTAETLAGEILHRRLLLDVRVDNRGRTQKVRWDAHVQLAEGEFNRFYMRAVCIEALVLGVPVEVYRAKQVKAPRPGSLGKL